MSAAPSLGLAPQPGSDGTVPRKISGPQVLESSGLVKIYGKRRVVDGVTFNVHRQEIVGLLGPNGAGKSTSFHMTVGLVRPEGGSVRIDDTDVTKLPMYRRARMGLGYLPQETSIFQKMSVLDNFRAILETLPLRADEREHKAQSLLQEFHLGHVGESLGGSLSGGEKRRTEIARCLIPSPGFILFDEPFAGVDPINVHEIQDQIRRLKDKGLGILITDHNVRETLKICDRAYLITEGHILTQGTPQQIAAHDQAREKYLGKDFKLD
jgi:lipopolysaccharide export system ATP-binding protein